MLRMGEVIANEATDKGLISKIHGNSCNSILEKQTTQSKMGRSTKETFLQRRQQIATNI